MLCQEFPNYSAALPGYRDGPAETTIGSAMVKSGLAACNYAPGSTFHAR
jgi:hypothetical protein